MDQSNKSHDFMVSEKILLEKSHCESMGANDTKGMANLDTRGMVGRIYVRDPVALLHTKYISCGPHGFK